MKKSEKNYNKSTNHNLQISMKPLTLSIQKNIMNKIIIIVLIATFSTQLLAQNNKIDGIVAVIGDEIVLNSDIDALYFNYKQEGYDLNNKCEIVDNILTQKMILYHAKNDTLIKLDNDYITRRVGYTIDRFTERAGGLDNLLKYYNVNTKSELETEIYNQLKENEYIDKKRSSIVGKLDVSPYELKEFYEKYGTQLPEVPEEVEVAQLVMYPKITEKHQQEIKEKLLKIKQDVLNGESFENKARLYSEDPGSAKNGGLYENVRRGQMQKPFEATAFNLQEGEISDPVETIYGYHIIKLVKRKGQLLDLRHILISSVPNKEELTSARLKLDSIRQDIVSGKITFKEAVLKYSDDKQTKYNAGVITDENSGDDRIEKTKLPNKLLFNIAGLSNGSISDAFEDDFESRKAVKIVQLNNTVAAHKYSLETDYNRIKNFALNEKQRKELEKWVKEKIPSTFITIAPDYKKCTYNIDWLNEGDLK